MKPGNLEGMTLETEINETHSAMSNEGDSDECSILKSKSSLCRRIVDDISNEEYSNTNKFQRSPEVQSSSDQEQKIMTEETQTKKKRKKLVLNDSDSEEELILAHEDSLPTVGDKSLNDVDANDKIHSYKSMFQNTDLYDADGSSDEDLGHNDLEEEHKSKSSEGKSDTKGTKKRSGPQRKSKQSALEEIHSETQRLIRHSRVSLPYHQPKQRSLSEFLSRRKVVPIVPLKTSSEQLSEVWQSIEEREKSAEQFYKSESEFSEDDNILPEKNKNILPCQNNEDSSSETLRKNDVPAIITETSRLVECTSENTEDSVNASKHFESTSACDQLSLSAQDSSNKLVNNSKLLNNKMCLDNIEAIKEGSNNLNSENPFGTQKENSEDFQLILLSEKENLDSNGDSGLSHLGLNSNPLSHNLKPVDISSKLEVKKKLGLLNNSLLDVKLDVTPKISGNPEEVIDLEVVANKPSALKLVSRFMKHVSLKPKLKNKVENVSVAITEVNTKGEVVNLSEEILSIKTSEKSKPGETRCQLKAKLKQKIAQSREEQFIKRIEEYKLNEELIEGEKDLCSDIEDIDEEIELLKSSESESEPEENDVDLRDKCKKEKKQFLDEEAEETENEDDEADEVDPDCDNYSDPPSIDVAPLVDDKDMFTDDSKPQDSNTPGNAALGSDLMALCSGVFPTQTVSIKDLEKSMDSKSQSEGFDLFLPEDATMDICRDDSLEKELDESSDEEVTKRNKKTVRLEFSDDDDDQNSRNSIKSSESLEKDEEEVIDDNEVIETENEEEEIFDEEEDVVDEEEENIFHDPSKVAKRFLEDEAELSGSEYGSADEDEVDLDTYEEEQGDQDKINQKKLKSELEKIHMKEILDEDKREIRILQELLLEDGELHSEGPRRQRQFKWYNQDATDIEGGTYLNSFDDEENESESTKEVPEEEDESWRKTRLERENFLQELQNADDDFDISQCIKKYSKSENKSVKPAASKVPTIPSPNPKQHFSLMLKRGSFLNRGEKVLSKIAEMTNISNENALGGSRGKKNMVFAVVSPPKEEEPQEQVKKRKSITTLPGVTKRLKFSPGSINMSTGRKSIFENLD